MATTIEQDVHAALAGHAGLTALVGDRIYPVVLPEGVSYPAVRYQRIGGGPLQHTGGDSGLENARIQIDVWAKRYAQAKDTAEQVRAAIRTATAFKAVSVAEVDGYEDDTRTFRVTLDYSLWRQ